MQGHGPRGDEKPRHDPPTAADLGWDDSLYESPVPEQRGRRSTPPADEAKGVRDAEEAEATAAAGPSDAPTAEPGAAGTGRSKDAHVPGPRRRPGGGGGAARDGGGAGKNAERRRPARRRGRRVLRWVALSLAVLVLGTAGAAYLYLEHLNSNLARDELNLGDNRLAKSKPNADGQTPLNILLLGSDSRNSERNVELGGARDNAGRPPLADVQMLLHVSADRSNMSVVSVPRDTRVTIPKCTDPDDGRVYQQTDALTINTSLQHGGPGCTVATWEELTGVPIDHFMMIDFAGVVSMADAVGGVPVCVDANVYDKDSGLRLRKGTTTIKGEQALQWLRTRHGFENGSDIGRAKAQHMYMSAMVRELKAGTKLSNPKQLWNLAEAATKALTVDEEIGSVRELYDLANDIKRVPTRRITMLTMPWTPDPRNPNHVVPKEGEAEHVFSLLRDDVALDGKDARKPRESPEPTKPTAPKSEIAVTVLNGTGTVSQPAVTGRAGVLTQELVSLGFTQAVTDATPRSQADTAVLYPRRAEHGNALAVAKALGIPERLVRASSGVEQVTLIIGADWREGTAYPKPSPDEGQREPTGAPDSADALNGDDEKACMKVNPAYTW